MTLTAPMGGAVVSPRGRAARSTRASGHKEAQSERQQQRKMRRREKARPAAAWFGI